MAYKREAQGAPKMEYQPYAWRLVSGNIEKDAFYVVKLATRYRRLREMSRLKDIHGRAYALDVEKRVAALWPQREEILMGRLSAEVVKQGDV